MKTYVLVDTPQAMGNLRPLTYCRPISELRIGITTIREKWERKLGAKCTWQTVDYLQEKFPCVIEGEPEYINSNEIPDVGAVEHLWDIFQLNGKAIVEDFKHITAGRRSAPISDSCTVIGDPSLVFIEEDASVQLLVRTPLPNS